MQRLVFIQIIATFTNLVSLTADSDAQVGLGIRSSGYCGVRRAGIYQGLLIWALFIPGLLPAIRNGQALIKKNIIGQAHSLTRSLGLAWNNGNTDILVLGASRLKINYDQEQSMG